eukprot:766052-Hanusia_phi.AAC.2
MRGVKDCNRHTQNSNMSDERRRDRRTRGDFPSASECRGRPLIACPWLIFTPPLEPLSQSTAGGNVNRRKKLNPETSHSLSSRAQQRDLHHKHHPKLNIDRNTSKTMVA